MKRPLILISNDDGYNAKGIRKLAEMVSDLGDVVIVAPDSPRSGAGMSITSHDPIYVSEIEEHEGLMIYSCSGTPCDCVKVALERLLPSRPDIIIGGINHGDNSAVNAHYSGTVAVALEGCIKGIPSIGISLDSYSPDADFDPLRPFVRRIVKGVIEGGLPQGVYLNVNCPCVPKSDEIRICRMGHGDWVNEWEERAKPNGGRYFWLTGEYVGDATDDETTDRVAVDQGYVAVTPIITDLTAYNMMEQLKAQFA